MSRRFARLWYEQSTLRVARGLLGAYLVVKQGRKLHRRMIVETEAYCGVRDLACHSARGRTPRTEVMFGSAGHAYVYLIYGMYHCLNVVTRDVDQPEAVLIRAVEGSAGPGKLCRDLGVIRVDNSEDLVRGKRMWIEQGQPVPSREVVARPRVGVDYAGEWADKKWRFYIKNHPSISRR